MASRAKPQWERAAQRSAMWPGPCHTHDGYLGIAGCPSSAAASRASPAKWRQHKQAESCVPGEFPPPASQKAYRSSFSALARPWQARPPHPHAGLPQRQGPWTAPGGRAWHFSWPPANGAGPWCSDSKMTFLFLHLRGAAVAAS